MEQILKTLQEIQAEAFAKGVYSFALTSRIFKGDTPEDTEKGILVSIFLRGDDSDGDYFTESIYETTFAPEYKIERIKAFINTL